jgi:methionine-S-sulfoxide reductase
MTDVNQTAYLSGGCFWGMEDLVRKIPGVLETEVGYTGGDVPDATYEIVSTGRSGHAESLKIVCDPGQLTYRHLLFEFFRMHNPTTRNRQGNDIGTQYRSAIFYLNEEQKRIAEDVIKWSRRLCRSTRSGVPRNITRDTCTRIRAAIPATMYGTCGWASERYLFSLKGISRPTSAPMTPQTSILLRISSIPEIDRNALWIEFPPKEKSVFKLT